MSACQSVSRMRSEGEPFPMGSCRINAETSPSDSGKARGSQARRENICGGDAGRIKREGGETRSLSLCVHADGARVQGRRLREAERKRKETNTKGGQEFMLEIRADHAEGHSK